MTIPVEITPAMIDAGVVAYLAEAVHDQFSYWTPQELIAGVLRAGMAAIDTNELIESIKPIGILP